ncbi:MAG: DUF2480 family protein [Ferruginibacter sp.]
MEPMVNKVADSGIITLDLEKFLPVEENFKVFDMKDYLFMELILKEKDFRAALKVLDTAPYQDKTIILTCSTDAIIPVWAYMLVASLLQPVAKQVFFGTAGEATQKLLLQKIENLEVGAYEGQRVVIKGCGEKDIPASAYVAITEKLRPVARSIMYGEPCSTVPVYKKPLA